MKIIAAMLAIAVMAGCNTMAGAGKDVQALETALRTALRLIRSRVFMTSEPAVKRAVAMLVWWGAWTVLYHANRFQQATKSPLRTALLGAS